MWGLERALRTSRVHADSYERVGIPLPRTACGVCSKFVHGVGKPFGITAVCGKADCLLVAQAKDRGLKGVSNTVVERKHAPQLCGMVLAYLGDQKWAVGFVHDEDRKCDWVKDLSYLEAASLMHKQKHLVVSKGTDELFSDVSG